MNTLVRRALPPAVARPARLLASYPRFWVRKARARRAYAEHGRSYPQPLLFVAGLPKSGTTWMEGMLSEYPGFEILTPPPAIVHELRHGGSHSFELSEHLLDGLSATLAIVKLHLHGSPTNARLLREHKLRYVVMFRDLRDVAVSHYFYVRNTPWHPEHPTYRHLSPQEGLMHFADTLLDPFVDWIRDWKANGDPELGLTIRYEELLEDPERGLTRIAGHFGLDASPGTVQGIVDRHSFKRRAGRKPGDTDNRSFFRKGVAGDWRNHFTPEIEKRFLDHAGSLLDWVHDADSRTS